MPLQLFPHIKSVMDKYKHKLPRDDLKRFGKQVCTSGNFWEAIDLTMILDR